MKLKDIVNEKNDVRKYMSIDIPDEVRYELENWDYDVDTVLQAARIYVDANKFDEEVIPLKLDDNQKIVLEWLKNEISENDLQYTLWSFAEDVYEKLEIGAGLAPYIEAWEKLKEKQKFEVLAAFAQWGREEAE